MSQDSVVKRICVYGIGGVGGYFGSKIAHAINGSKENHYECYFIARGEHLGVIQRDGIKVVSPERTMVGLPTKASDNINDLPDPDLFLVCVKSYDLNDVIKSIQPKVNRGTVIIPLLNGADIYDRIRSNLDSGIVLPACVFVGTHIQEPGVIHQNGGDGKILFGRDPQIDCRADHVRKAFDDMGINYQWDEDPLPAIWSKYIFIASFGLVTVYTGKTLGEILDNHEATTMVRQIMREVYGIAEKKGIQLPPSIIEASIEKANNFPYGTKTSYQRDVEAKGSVNEGDLFGGTIIREGETTGVSTPLTSSIYSEIQNRLMPQGR